ncbi:DUF1080 domain-containing protein [Bacteroides sp. 51]|uniref:3-keto-disaccharide hydrolase n=1 Tax=Bacteroides sp. 51 TaxID=2302938 RepID=UPI0013D22C1E|nr:family 16 glycoside hydrolase [Bacteroides sp. 51]NDV81592.1 DUF1080 domain-containing protein [Bacteroides sp. 51]
MNFSLFMRTLFFVLFGLAMSIPETSANEAMKDVVKLLARDATIEGGLRIEDKGQEKATIHGWHNVNDVISWKTNLKKGNYVVSLNYSEPYSGGAATVTIGRQQFAVLIQPTGSWTEYKTFDLGVINVENPGDAEIILKAIQLTLKGKEHKEALPDIHWLTLTPTKEKATSQPVDIVAKFKGKTIFYGKTFKGWKGNDGEKSMEWFRIEDGAIVGGTMERPIPRNEFLSTTKQYGNFELRLKFKMKYPEGTGSWNGGVQFRSVPHPETPYEMVGYQADIIPWKWGALYDEQRRWTFLGTSLNTEEVKKVTRYDEWNSYIIRCEGPRIRMWLNGIQTLDYIEYDPAIPQTGYIAVQIHEDKNPCEAWYKDIEIQEF